MTVEPDDYAPQQRWAEPTPQEQADFPMPARHLLVT
jgi:hypothetical protein